MPDLSSLAEIAGTFSSLFVSGAIFAFSVGGVNNTKLAVTASPVLAAQQWEYVYSRSHKVGTPLVVFSAACFSWLKYKTNNNLYLCAAASCMSIVPYTALILSVPDRTLFAAASAKHKSHLVPSMREVQQALGQWDLINAVRLLFPLASGLIVLVSHIL
ncbi:hypothetical protein BDW60DRAFT_224463 [Aspergillus nidulans var. acristatus]